MDAGVVSGLLQIGVFKDSHLNRELLASEVSRAKGQPPQAVAAARGRLRRRCSSPMRLGIALVAPPCIRPRGARTAAGPDARRRDESDAEAHRRGAPTPQ